MKKFDNISTCIGCQKEGIRDFLLKLDCNHYYCASCFASLQNYDEHQGITCFCLECDKLILINKKF